MACEIGSIKELFWHIATDLAVAKSISPTLMIFIVFISMKDEGTRPKKRKNKEGVSKGLQAFGGVWGRAPDQTGYEKSVDGVGIEKTQPDIERFFEQKPKP